MRTPSKETKPVKSIPKDFSDANPVKRDKTPSGPVKSIPKIFSDTNPVKEDKTTFQQSPNGIYKPIPDITLLIFYYLSANSWAL